MNTFDEQDLHRLVKQALDSGVAQTLDEALALFAGYSLDITIDKAAVHNPAHQAALLTTVALARRVFLGGVRVAGNLDAPVLVPMPLGDFESVDLGALRVAMYTEMPGAAPTRETVAAVRGAAAAREAVAKELAHG